MPRKVVPADQLHREQQCLELRRAGLSYDAIAERVGFSDGTPARKAYLRALARTLQPAADEARKYELDVLMRVQVSIWPAVLRGDLGAVDRFIRLSEARRRLLGLDAPVKAQVRVEETTAWDTEVAELVAQLGERPALPAGS